MALNKANLPIIHQLISAIAAPTCLICERGGILSNESFLQLLGISPDDPLISLERIFQAQEREWFFTLCKQYPDTAEKLPIRRQIPVLNEHGHTIPALFNVDIIMIDAAAAPDLAVSGDRAFAGPATRGHCCVVLTLIEIELDSNQRGRRLFNNEDVIFVEWLRGDYNFIGKLSPNIEQFGYTQEEFLSGERSYNDIIHPSDLDWIKENIDRVMDQKVPYSYWEYRIICKNGEIRWVGDFTIADYQHPTISAVSYLLDITPFRKVSDALSSSRRMYRQLARHLPRMNVILYNNELRLVIVEGDLAFLDKSAEGKTIRDVLTAKQHEQLVSYFRGALAGIHNKTELHIDEHYYTLDFLPVNAEENGTYHGMLVIEDVTESYRIQEELRVSRERLDNIIDSVDDIIWSIQATPFEVIYISNGVEDVYGYTEAEFITQKELWLGVIHPDDRAAAYGEWANLAKMKASDLEFRVVRKDGTVRWVRSRSKAVMDAASGQLRIDGITTDITARKEAEKALRESEELYRLLAHNVSDMIARTELDSTFTFVTPSSVNAMGYTPEELLGTKATDYIHPDDYEATRIDMQNSLESPRKDMHTYYRVMHKSGSWIWLEATGRPVLDAQNNPIGFQFVARDVTQRKSAEDALRKSNERFRQIAENIHELFYIFENGDFTYISPAFETIWGRSADQVYKKASAYLDWIHPDDRARVLEGLRRERHNNIPFSEEYRVMHSDGTVHWIWARNFPVVNNEIDYRIVGIAEDITERKLAEIALKESQARFQQIAENISEVFFVRDVVNDKYIYISPAFEKIWKQPVSAVYEDVRTLFDFIHPDDREMMEQNARERQIRPVLSDEEYRIIRGENEVRWVRVRGYPVEDDQQKTTYVVGTAEDITERKQAEIALKESEARFQQIAENINEVFYVRDVRIGRYVYISPAFETVWRQPVAPLYESTKNFLRTVHPEDVEKVRQMWQQIQANPRQETLEYRIVHEDGTIRWIHTRNYPIFDKEGTLTHYVGTAEDITERKEAAMILKESEERLQLALKTANLGTWDWNLVTDEITSNDHFYELLGWDKSKNPQARHPMRELISPDELPDFGSEITQVREEGFLDRTEFRVVRPDGTPRWLASQAHVDYNEDGQPIRIMGIIQDITDMKENEEHRIALALAEERSALLAEFLGNMSHDLRTPLTVINTSLDMLERYALDDEGRKRRTGVIRLQTQLLENMIQNILTMSQLDHNPSVTFAPVNINRMLREIEDSLHAFAELRKITFIHDYGENLHHISGSESHLYRALSNLVKNAINYSGEGGTITLSTMQTGPYVKLKIADTGIGIGEKDLPYIFDRFYRADKARPSDDGGTGLGLAIVKKIVEMHNSEISVESELGKGTTFTVTLPVRPW